MNKFCRQRLKKNYTEKSELIPTIVFSFDFIIGLGISSLKIIQCLWHITLFFSHKSVPNFIWVIFKRKVYYFFFWLEKSILLHLGAPKYKIYLYLALSFHFMIVGVVHIGGRLVGTVGPIISPCIFGKKIQVKLFSEPLIFSAHLIQIEIWHNS